MYQLVKTMTSLEIAARQIIVFGVAFVIATVFYKFGSFGLEAVAFLATWLLLDAIVELLDKFRPTRDPQEEM